MQKYAVEKGYNFLSLAGGKYHVDDLTTFYQEYAQFLDNKVPMFLVELKPNIYRFFMDLDYDDIAEIEFDQLFQMIHSHVHELTQQDELIILAAPVKQTQTNEGLIANKHGFHLIWPTLLVNNAHAKAIRTSILDVIYKAFPQKAWDKMYDASVYHKNGLRMIGSRKSRKEAREYAFYASLSIDDGLSKEHHYTTLELVQRTVLTPPEGAHAILTPLSNDVYLSQEDKAGTKDLDFKERVVDESFQAIQNFISKHFSQKMKFLDCHRTQNGFYFVRTSSKFCLNVSREHKSNTIYFFISNVALHQRCFCRCETTEGRKYGLCKHFKSKGILLPMALKKKLFPEQSQVTETDQLVSLLSYLEAYISTASTRQ